jgi:hypothetical protein
MNEGQWLACENPQEMLAFLGSRASGRKLRLFAVACCRRIWHLMADPRSRKAVEVAEGFADGLVSEAGRDEAEAAAESVRRVAYDPRSECVERPDEFAAWAAHSAVDGAADNAARLTTADVAGARFSERWQAGVAADGSAAEAREQSAHADLLRDIFGSLPFRPISFDPSWLTWHDGLLVSMARRMYEARDFADMPILADALEEAGCQDGQILGHCRQADGVHVRGCWLIDLLLGKG